MNLYLGHPDALWLLLAAIPIVGLHLVPRAKTSLPTAVGFLWQQALAQEAFRQKWLRWRGLVSLAVELLILTLMTAALADPCTGPQAAETFGRRDAVGVWWPILAGSACVLLVLQWPLHLRRWLS